MHPLLVGARKHFEGVRETDSGYLRPTKRRLVDLFVSAGTLERALTLANTYFLALERHGYRVTLAPWGQQLGRPYVDVAGKGRRDLYEYRSWSPDRPTLVYVGTVAIGLTFFELSAETDVQYVDGKYVPVKRVPLEQRLDLLRGHGWTHKQDMPNGRLCLRASSPYAHATWEKLWPEEKKGELRSKLPQVIQELASAASTIAALVEEGERRAELQRQEWERQQEQWRREAAERRRVQNIKDSREQLGAIIEAWGAAKRVEGFFEDAERRAATLGDVEREMMLERLHRARELLGGTDALRQFLTWRAPEER